MSDNELITMLKELPHRVDTASFNEREEIVQLIQRVLESSDVTENIIKGLHKLILLTLPRYHDKKSQELILGVVYESIKLYEEWSVKHLANSLYDYAESVKNNVSTNNLSKTSLTALRWSSAILDKSTSEIPAPVLEKLLHSQAICCSHILQAHNSDLAEPCPQLLKYMRKLLKSTSRFDYDIKYLEIIINRSEVIAPYILFGALLYESLHQREQLELGDKYKTKLLEQLIKVFITTKTKPAPETIESCGTLIKTITIDDFKSVLMPAIQKALLRSPETILQSVSFILAGVEVDLSDCALDLGKAFVTNMHSNNDSLRDEAEIAYDRLARRCGNVSIVKQLLVQIFGVYNGSEGKLTVLTQKMSVLKGAGNLSVNKVLQHVTDYKFTKEKQDLVDIACENFIKVLEAEVNEACLCFAIQQMSRWSLHYDDVEIPKKFVASVKKCMELKTTTPTVRAALIGCLLECIKNKNSLLIAQPELLPVLIKSVERTVAQPAQYSVVTEGLYATRLLLRFVKKDQSISPKLQALWNVLFDMDKQVFVGEKFLTSVADEVLIQVGGLCETLLNDYLNKFKLSDPKQTTYCTAPLYRAIIHGVCATPYTTRTHCIYNIKQLVKSQQGIQHTCAFLNEMTAWLEYYESTLKNRKDSEDGSKKDVKPKAFVECLQAICSRPEISNKETNKVILATLLPVHHSLVYSVSTNLWTKIITHWKMEPKKVIGNAHVLVHKLLVDDFEAKPSYENALKTIALVAPDLIFPKIMTAIKVSLTQPGLLQITKNDYFTYLTPEDELYDKSVIPNKDETQNSVSNVKRESKVYSYKEQQEEMALRKEILEKKKQQGKIVEPQYTAKQLEIIKAQKDREAGIRKKLQQLNEVLIKTTSQIKSCAKGNPEMFSLYYRTLIPIILNTLRSPLAAPYTTELFIQLSAIELPIGPTKIFKTLLSDLIANVTLRLYKPECDLNPEWDVEPLTKACQRAITMLHEATVQNMPKKSADSDDGFSLFAILISSFVSMPEIAYVFPFLRKTLLLNQLQKEDKVILDGLQVLSHHSKIQRFIPDDYPLKHIYDPKLLPYRGMFELLVELISTTQPRVQMQSVACLLDVAKCFSSQQENNPSEKCHLQSDELEVLLMALQNPAQVVRDAALRSMLVLKDVIPTMKEDKDLAMKVTRRIWIALYDIDEEIKKLAEQFWTGKNLEINPNLCDMILDDLQHPVECIQQAAAASLHAYLSAEDNVKRVDKIIQKMLQIFKDKLNMIPSKLDNFGREIEPAVDVWGPRRGIALAIKELAPLLNDDLIAKLALFFVQNGLGDRNEVVRREMLNAAMRVVDLHGKTTINLVLPVFEKFMDKAPKSSSFDDVRLSVVILMGSLACHLDETDARIKPIVMRLVSALNTPSQQVQEAAANCLATLVNAVKDDAPQIMNKLLHQLLKAEKYGDRRGAAYGIAGFVKGLGILSLKQLDIMTKLIDAIQDKKNFKHREGALFAFEMLCSMLGRLFEPYIVHVLPHLLLCFGDSSQYVRTATEDTARVVMSRLSGHGVKLVLPSLLSALDDDSWRTKTGSVELLGSMAYCAPKQLSSCLPSIVPKLIEVLSDSHIKVQEAGAEALRVIGSVIRNPEIQAIVPVLLQALQDPSNKTSICLQTLLDTQFVHFIDAPSLALIMPVVQRAFQDRSTETRKMAAQIIGNMYSLTDQKDLKPYLPTIIPGLKMSLLDPVPEVRSVSARALGAMVRGLGESGFEDLLPWLMHMLTSESSSVDRSGAAQGLSEVVAGLGVDKLHKLMPEIIGAAERNDIPPHVKDGYIMMFIYLPGAFTEEFTPYIGQIINPILQALADENEYVRETALKAGQRIVNLYAESAIVMLLPELERGLFDDNWRIRYSSVQLLGDLLYRISGVSGKMSTETASEDDNFGTEQSHLAIITSLGPERRNRVLAGLYMGRSDVALMVRQAALHVWKVVVTNTPKTLREILPTLFTLLLGCLASTSYDKRQVAARTLGDLVRKLGERVLPEIIPILEEGLQSEQADTRQGVCIGLSEIMASTSRDMVMTFSNSLVPTVRKALSDPLPEVRQAAAKTFDSLHSTIGVKALDDILPNLLNQLNSEDEEVVECTLDGLRQVMAIKSRVVLPYLVPQLSAPPVNTKALSILASVAGEALTRFLPKILPALLSALSDAHGTPDEQQQLEYCQAVVLSVVDDAGTRMVIDQLLEHTRSSDNAAYRRSAAALLCAFCGMSKANVVPHIPQLLRGLIHLCTDENKEVILIAWEALCAVTKSIDVKHQSAYVSDVRQAVRYAISDSKQELIAGFCLPKGITPVLPIFREALLNGDGDEKEAAAQGLGEVIKVTSAQSLQPSVVTITGPLIRILGDRFNWPVKAAVLETLAILLTKVGIMLKQFLPQLQTTFLKALNDPTRQVRVRAAYALGQLIIIHARCDPVFTELHNNIRNTDDGAIRETTLLAMRNVITAGGDKMTDPLKKQIRQTFLLMLDHADDMTRLASAGCLGALTKYLTGDSLSETLTSHLLNDDCMDNWQLRHGRSAALSVALKEAPHIVYTPEYENDVNRTLLARLTCERPQIAMSAIRACGYLFQYLMNGSSENVTAVNGDGQNGELELTKCESRPIPQSILVPFMRTMNHTSNDVKQLLARVSTHLARNVAPEKMAPEFVKLLLPTLVNGTKEKNSYVKANSEIALITVLKLKQGDAVCKRCLALLDVGAQESLEDVISKVLKKVMSQAEGKEEELDDTLVT